MTRGNQRELDRAKNLKKKKQVTGKEREIPEGQSLQNVKLQYKVDAEIMRRKQAEALARKQETEKVGQVPKSPKK